MRCIAIVMLVAGLVRVGFTQDRDTRVRTDRANFAESKDWIYNDLGAGIAAARETGKPLFVVFRCIPCEACQEFDDDVARRDPMIRDLLDRFVCVRIVQANAMDLSKFQHDFDQSFAAYFLNADMTIYGRFGTRSEREEAEDISLQGLRKAMEGALRIHAMIDRDRPALEGKQVRPGPFKVPTDYPSLAGRYDTSINFEGQVARSCMHCHQIGEAERTFYREKREPIPDKVIFPYPDPAVLGLSMDPREMATVTKVAEGSPAEVAGILPGDTIETLEGQPMLSIADLQWVLHNTPATGELAAQVRRDGQVKDVSARLSEGWRRGNIAWRATTWELRRMALGGLVLKDLSDTEREAAGLSRDTMALRVTHVGQYDAHAVAKRAGVQQGDVVVAYDGEERRLTESALLAHVLRRRQAGEMVTLRLVRDGETLNLSFAVQ